MDNIATSLPLTRIAVKRCFLIARLYVVRINALAIQQFEIVIKYQKEKTVYAIVLNPGAH